MRKMFLVLAMLSTATFIFTGCEPAANTNTANKPANAANNAANATAPASSAAIEADIKKLVTDAAAALAKNDADTLDKFYGDNYMLVDLDGSVKNKAERLAGIRSGETKFESLTYDDISVRTNPEGTGAVVIARATAKVMNKGQRTDGQVRVTQVWSKTKDGWKAVSGHATRITAAATGTTAANTANKADTANKANTANKTNTAKPPPPSPAANTNR